MPLDLSRHDYYHFVKYSSRNEGYYLDYKMVRAEANSLSHANQEKLLDRQDINTFIIQYQIRI